MAVHLYKYIFYLLIALMVSPCAHAQDTHTITVKKESGLFLFFQKGAKSDTITKGKNDIFYLLVPDSIKESIVFTTENGQLTKTANDSLVRLNYLPGMRYEYVYESELKPSGKYKAADKKAGSYKTLVNGASSYPAGKILLQIQNKRSGNLIGEIIYWYRPQ